MKRQATSFLRFVLTIALAVGIMLSSNAQSQSHDLAQIAAIMAEHQSEIEDHGHAHGDVVDILHAYEGHANEMADHDHNTAFLPPRRSAGLNPPARKSWHLTQIALTDLRAFVLDRPPRS